MPDNQPPEEHDPTPEEANDGDDKPKEAPASVVFMEMMRQAAALANPEPEPEEDDEPPQFTQAQINRMSEEERRRAAKIEQERVKRVTRRKQKRLRRRVSILGGVIRTFLVVFVSSFLMATILSWWTDADFLSPEIRRELQVAISAPTATPFATNAPTPNFMKTIGIVSGHRGPGQFAPFDPGAVCEDGLTENEINYNVAQKVVLLLRAQGYTVELLDEFDPRLDDYRAEALISIHANDCRDYGEVVSGYLVAKAAAKPEGGRDTQLAECIALEYSLATSLERRFGLTEDMTDYHSFREINPLTPAAIIEIGFMRADRALLTDENDRIALGIAEGVRCFLEMGQDDYIPPPPTPTLESMNTPEG